MKTFEFPPLTESVVLRFTCPCGEDITTEALRVPAANYEGDTHDKSLVTAEYEVECPECGQVFNITVGESVCGGEGWIDELDDEAEVEVEDTPIKE